MKFSLLLSALLTLTLPTFTTAYPSPPTTSTLQIAYAFPNNTWVENLAVRSNGNVLVTLITAPEVWEINPFTHSASLIASFPDAIGAAGIAEVGEDFFAVAVGNWSDVTGKATPGSYSVWGIDFGCRDEGKGSGKGEVKIKKVTDIPEAEFLNGMTALDQGTSEGKGKVLVGDADKGVVWRVDVKTGKYEVVVVVEEFKPNPEGAIELGVNGIRYVGSWLYFVNSFDSIYARIPLNNDGTAAGDVETIASPLALNGTALYPDDFTVDAEGNAWISTASNFIVKVTPEGNVTEIAPLVGCTSAAFGRTRFDRDRLYITSDGGLSNPAADEVQPGRLWYVDTSKL